MRELSDEEIRVINQIPPEEYKAEPDWWLRVSRKVAHQAHLNAIRGMVELFESRAITVDCQCGCWQELKKLAEKK